MNDNEQLGNQEPSLVFVSDDAVRLVPGQVYPYSAGAIGGLVGGLLIAPVAMLAGIAEGLGPWYFPNLAAATVVPSVQGTPLSYLTEFHLLVVLGVVLHLMLSVGIGLVFSLVLPTLPGPAWVWSLIIGPVLWFGAQFVVLPLVNPVLSEALWLPSFFAANVVYGLALGSWLARSEPVSTGLALARVEA